MTRDSKPHIINRDAEDAQIYPAVYHALVVGMATSTALFALGVGLALWRASAGRFVVDVTHAYHLRNLVPGLLSLDPIAVMVLATIVMILTPIARVVVSLVAFLRERDYVFAMMTVFVLLSLAVTLFLGLSGRLV